MDGTLLRTDRSSPFYSVDKRPTRAPSRAVRLRAAPDPPPPDWWAGHFWRRQSGLRRRLLQALAALPDERWLVTHQVAARAYCYDRLEVEHCLAGLAAEGLLAWHRVREPAQRGASRLVDRDYWRLSPREAR